ncbi:MAG: transglutaminase domain-containing protein [Chlorobium sp.]
MRKKIIRVGHLTGLVVAVKIVVVLGMFVLFAAYTNVSTAYHDSSVAVFENILHLDLLRNPKNFTEEILAIRTLQAKTFAIAPPGEGIPDYEAREPADFIGRREGLCFDRSRTTDKALRYLGFPSRHVYLLFREKERGFWSSLIHYRHPSHAITEVKTSKGWMFVDSNTNWIALTRDRQVVNADDVWKRAAEFDIIPSYLTHPWWAIRGMYSRKGQLYPPYILFPDFNWYDLLTWLLFG